MKALDFLEKASLLIAKYPDKHDLDMPASDALITLAEEKLTLTFPISYQLFLKKFGVGAFCGDEFYGLINNNFENSSIPDVVWLNLDERKDGYVIDPVLMICFDGMGDYYSIDTTRTTEEGENPIILWTPGLSKDPNECEVVANSFGEFFYDMIKRSVEMIEEENAEPEE